MPWLLVWLFVMLTWLGLPVAAAGPKSGGHLVVAVPIDPDTFDPHKAVAAATREIDYNIYQGLVSFDTEGRIVPCLAESWETSDDGTVYTFTLRPNVFFHLSLGKTTVFS